jgi:hypothetical protein
MRAKLFFILLISAPFFGLSQYGSVELSSGGFSFIPAFTDFRLHDWKCQNEYLKPEKSLFCNTNQIT